MARPQSRPFGEIKMIQQGQSVRQMQEITLAEGRVNEGMITSLDPADIPNGALRLAKNVRVRFDRVSRRPGGILLTPTKPNSKAVLCVYYFKKSSGSEFFFRATKDTIHSRAGGVWTNVPPAVTTLAGDESDLMQFVAAFDRVFFVNNGVNPVQELVTTIPNYKVLNVSEATVKTNYRFLTAFFNRIVGANLQGGSPNPVQVGWSADGVLDEWNPSVNESAGSGPLVDSPGDFSDFLTGIFGFTNIMLVLREQSVWIATKNPIPTNPFNFYAAFPGVGCDCPYSAAVALNNLCWLDTRTKTVWAYSPNGTPEPIGRNVEKDILRAVDEKDRVFGSYKPDENEYTIGIPLAGAGITRNWTFNFRTKAWEYDEMEIVSRIADIPFASAGLSIDALPGTINELIGQINDLSPSDVSAYLRMYGRTDGEIVLEDINTYNDPAVSGSPDPNSGTFSTELESKDFETEEVDSYFSRITLKLRAYTSGSVRLEYSKDGKAFVVAKTKTFTVTELNKSSLLKFSKVLHCRRVTWRLVATNGYFDVEGFEVKVYPSGTYRK